MDLKFWLQMLVPPLIGLIGTLTGIWIAILQYRKRKEEEIKVESLKFLLGAANGWQSYIMSAANAITFLRNHIRGKTDEGIRVKRYSSMNDVEAAVEEHGVYLHGLHSGVTKELEGINKLFKDI